MKSAGRKISHKITKVVKTRLEKLEVSKAAHEMTSVTVQKHQGIKKMFFETYSLDQTLNFEATNSVFSSRK